MMRLSTTTLAVLFVVCLSFFNIVSVQAASEDAGGDDDLAPDTADDDLGASREGSRTDSEVVSREEEAIKLDGLSVAEMKELRDKAEKHVFQVDNVVMFAIDDGQGQGLLLSRFLLFS